MVYTRQKIATSLDSADTLVQSTRHSFKVSTGKYQQKSDVGKFIKGPIDFRWMQKANSLPGKAGAVGLSLWFLQGVKQSSTFIVSSEAEKLTACSRQAYSRALLALAKEGLIRIQARPGARPTVTIYQI